MAYYDNAVRRPPVVENVRSTYALQGQCEASGVVGLSFNISKYLLGACGKISVLAVPQDVPAVWYLDAL